MPSNDGAGTARPGADMASVAERMGYMQALRVALASVVLAAGMLAPDIVGVGPTDLVPGTIAYLVLTLAAEGLLSFQRRRSPAIITALLLLDGVYLAWALYLSGGALSPLRFLVFVHIVAVTLLASHRTGLKIALWHSLLTVIVLYVQVTDVLPSDVNFADTSAGDPARLERLTIFNIAAFWLAALATAAFSAINERELRRRQSDLTALADMAAELENVTEATAIAAIFLEKAESALGFGRGAVMQVSDGAVIVLAVHPNAHATVASRPEPLLDVVPRTALDRREPIVVRDVNELDNPLLSRLLPRAHRVVVVPLFAEAVGLGVAVLENQDANTRDLRAVAMATQFASHVALALRNARLLEEVQRLAETDPLTGVANRRLFEITLTRELKRAERQEDPITLVMLDVDHFKPYNDTYGHQAGDEVLRRVAHMLSTACREFDTVARYGGEEFAVILPGCSSEESTRTAERLREAIAGVDAAHPITASAGVATYPTDAAGGESLVKKADEALYESKRAGRNRVTRSGRRAQQHPRDLPESA